MSCQHQETHLYSFLWRVCDIECYWDVATIYLCKECYKKVQNVFVLISSKDNIIENLLKKRFDVDLALDILYKNDKGLKEALEKLPLEIYNNFDVLYKSAIRN